MTIPVSAIRRRLLAVLDPRKAVVQAHRARYMREIYRKAHKTLNVTLSQEQFETVIVPRAAQAGLTVTEYLREAAFAYAEQRYLVPGGLEAALWAVSDQLAGLGNNLNQIARHTNLEHQATRQDLADARRCLERAEQLVESAVRSPPLAP
jgi:hypothetical protein